jgi:hypothetical protein
VGGGGGIVGVWYSGQSLFNLGVFSGGGHLGSPGGVSFGDPEPGTDSPASPDVSLVGSAHGACPFYSWCHGPSSPGEGSDSSYDLPGLISFNGSDWVPQVDGLDSTPAGSGTLLF